jgi:hypothetical protein
MPIYQRADKLASAFKARGAPVLSSSQRSGRMIERKLSAHLNRPGFVGGSHS